MDQFYVLEVGLGIGFTLCVVAACAILYYNRTK